MRRIYDRSKVDLRDLPLLWMMRWSFPKLVYVEGWRRRNRNGLNISYNTLMAVSTQTVTLAPKVAAVFHNRNDITTPLSRGRL